MTMANEASLIAENRSENFLKKKSKMTPQEPKNERFCT